MCRVVGTRAARLILFYDGQPIGLGLNHGRYNIARTVQGEDFGDYSIGLRSYLNNVW